MAGLYCLSSYSFFRGPDHHDLDITADGAQPPKPGGSALLHLTVRDRYRPRILGSSWECRRIEERFSILACELLQKTAGKSSLRSKSIAQEKMSIVIFL